MEERRMKMKRKVEELQLLLLHQLLLIGLEVHTCWPGSSRWKGQHAKQNEVADGGSRTRWAKRNQTKIWQILTIYLWRHKKWRTNRTYCKKNTKGKALPANGRCFSSKLSSIAHFVTHVSHNTVNDVFFLLTVNSVPFLSCTSSNCLTRAERQAF